MSDTLTEAPADPHGAALDRIEDLRRGLLEVVSLVAANPTLPVIDSQTVEYDTRQLVLRAHLYLATAAQVADVARLLGDEAEVTMTAGASGHRTLRVQRSFGPVTYEAWTTLESGADTVRVTPIDVADLDNLLPAGAETVAS